MASNPIVNMFKIKELRNRLFFTLMVLAVFRLGSVLTIPGIDASALLSYFDNLAKNTLTHDSTLLEQFDNSFFFTENRQLIPAFQHGIRTDSRFIHTS